MPNCINCSRVFRILKGETKKIKNEEEAERFSNLLNKNVNVADIICSRCRGLPYRRGARLQSITQSSALRNISAEKFSEDIIDMIQSEVYESEENLTNEDSDEEFCYQISRSSDSVEKLLSDNVMKLPIKRVIASYKYCFLCKATKNLKAIPIAARVQVFNKKHIFIPSADQCCESHLIGNIFFEDEVSTVQAYSSSSYLNPKEIKIFLEQDSGRGDTSLLKKLVDFSMPQKHLKAFTGLNWENIIELREMLAPTRISCTRSLTQALIVFLMKMTTGNSNRLISRVLGLQSEQVVSNYCTHIIKCFAKDILPNHFGLNTASRENLINNHTTYLAKRLYNLNNELMLICDGTYIRHQNSPNNEYQRKSYSSPEKIPSYKPFTICCSGGYIVDFVGPFSSTENDAAIMKTLIEDTQCMKNLLQKGDIFLIDSAFRNVTQLLKNKGFVPLIPASKARKKQLNTKESNHSRKITKLRSVVEALHGTIDQKFKLLRQILDNKMLRKVITIYRIAGFLHNKFGKQLQTDMRLADYIIDQMNAKIIIENNLSTEIEEENRNKKKIVLKSLRASEMMDFPKLTEEDLKILFAGSYQLNQTIAYLAELTGEEEKPQIKYVKQLSNILNAEIKSRHNNERKYQCYVEYTPNGVCLDDIKRYACNCINGKRTVGCCSHIASLIYYLSYARYLSRIFKPSELLTRIFNESEVAVVINSDSEED